MTTFRFLKGAVLLSLLAALLYLPISASADNGLPGASVSVCQVTGSASAPNYAQVSVLASDVNAYLNQYPGSFQGTCPASGSGAPLPGSGLPGASVSVCQVTGSASAPNYTQVSVLVTNLAAYLNQYPGSFQGTCPAGGSSGGGLPNGSVSVCQLTGSASAPNYAQADVLVSNLGAYLNQNPGSFVGTCGNSSAPAGTPDTTPNGFVTICQVTGNLSAPHFAQASLAVNQLQAALNRNPASYVGACPSAGDTNGQPGTLPNGFVTLCKLTGNAATPYLTQTVEVSKVAAYLNQAGNILASPTGGCPEALPASGGSVSGGQGPGSTTGNGPEATSPGQSSTVTVQSTPNTVVTARGAGVNKTTKTNNKGQAKIQIKPKKKGIIVIAGAGGKTIKKIGVAGAQSGAQLTG